MKRVLHDQIFQLIQTVRHHPHCALSQSPAQLRQ
ncbi:Uncharacterised protein [Vibrio cholerae]|nr:Uncharacterised protein [Vibrio cholerae]